MLGQTGKLLVQFDSHSPWWTGLTSSWFGGQWLSRVPGSIGRGIPPFHLRCSSPCMDNKRTPCSLKFKIQVFYCIDDQRPSANRVGYYENKKNITETENVILTTFSPLVALKVVTGAVNDRKFYQNDISFSVPVDIRRNNNVIITSKRHRKVVL